MNSIFNFDDEIRDIAALDCRFAGCEQVSDLPVSQSAARMHTASTWQYRAALGWKLWPACIKDAEHALQNRQSVV